MRRARERMRHWNGGGSTKHPFGLQVGLARIIDDSSVLHPHAFCLFHQRNTVVPFGTNAQPNDSKESRVGLSLSNLKLKCDMLSVHAGEGEQVRADDSRKLG